MIIEIVLVALLLIVMLTGLLPIYVAVVSLLYIYNEENIMDLYDVVEILIWALFISSLIAPIAIIRACVYRDNESIRSQGSEERRRILENYRRNR